MLGVINKDIMYRKIYAASEKITTVYKFQVLCFNLGKYYRNMAYVNDTIFTVSLAFLKNKCLSTLRSRSVYRILKLSRVEIRKVFKLYRIVGMKKGSW